MLLTHEPQHYSILIADDDAGSRDTLRDIVAPEGFQTRIVESGEEAVDVVQAEEIHLVICDMYMPRLTGLDTLRLVKQLNELLPFVLVSGEVNDQLVRQALNAKAYSVIAKPVSKNVILYTVVRALIKAYEAQP